MSRTRWWTTAVAALASEVAALVALGWWGATEPGGSAARFLLGAGLPVAAAVLWGLFAAPRAVVDVPVLRVATKLLVLGSAAAALVAMGAPVLAGLLVAAALLGHLPAGASTPGDGRRVSPASR